MGNIAMLDLMEEDNQALRKALTGLQTQIEINEHGIEALVSRVQALEQQSNNPEEEEN